MIQNIGRWYFMSKKNFSYLYIIIITLVSIVFYIDNEINTEHITWLFNYGIKVPKTETYAYYESGPRGDGEIYTICQYDDKGFQKLASMHIWSTISNQSEIDSINNHIATMKDWISLSNTPDKEIFSKYPILIKKGYLYYLKPKESDGFFLLVANKDNKKLYALELTN